MPLTPSRHDAKIAQIGACLIPIVPVIVTGVLGYFDADPSMGELVGLFAIGVAIHVGLIAVHELGHALAALATGFEMTEINIGHGRPILSAAIGGTKLTLRMFPASGLVRVKPSVHSFSLARVGFFLAAGPLVEFIVIVLAILVLPPVSRQWEHSFDTVFLMFLRVSVLVLGAIHLLDTLLPIDGWVGDRKVPTDGKQLLRLWQGRKTLDQQRALFLQAQPLNDLLRQKDFPAALVEALALTEKYPANVGLVSALASIHEELGDPESAIQCLKKFLARSGLSVDEKVATLDRLSTLILYFPTPARLLLADRWTNEAITIAPAAVTLKGTRGGLLVELGRLDEGSALLTEVVAQSTSSIDQAISLAYLARIAAAQGDYNTAQSLLTRSRKLGIENPIIKRIASELSAPAAASGSQLA